MVVCHAAWSQNPIVKRSSFMLCFFDDAVNCVDVCVQISALFRPNSKVAVPMGGRFFAGDISELNYLQNGTYLAVLSTIYTIT